MTEKAKFILIVISSLFLSACSTNSIPNAESILINLSSSFPGLWRLATAFAYILGFSIIMRAVHHLKVYGEGRTMMSSHHSLKTPILLFIVGSALIFLPTTYQSLLETTFGTTTTSPIGYSATPIGISPIAAKAFFQFIQVCGLFAFIRGWIIISRAAEQSNQPGTFGRGLTHILGGLLAINIIGTKDVLFSTIGLN